MPAYQGIRLDSGELPELAVLAARGITVPDDIRQRITSCTDLDQLEMWVRRAATAESIYDVFG